MHTLKHEASTSTERARRPDDLVRAAGWCGVVGPILFSAMLLIQTITRREEFDPISEPASGLGAGTLGWIQSINFAVFGVLTLVFAIGLHRAMAPSFLGWAGPVLIAITGVGLLWAAVFALERDDTGVLYDPGLHAVGGTMFFVVGALAIAATIPRMYRDDRWRSLVPYTVTVAALVVVAIPVVVVFTIPVGAPLHAYGGLVQLTIILALRFPWQLAVATRMLRTAADRSLDRSPFRAMANS